MYHNTSRRRESGGGRGREGEREAAAMRGAAAQLYREVDPEPRQYRDRRFPGSDEEYYQALATSKTVGFCSFVISLSLIS